jgi:hypothetical protein
MIQRSLCGKVTYIWEQDPGLNKDAPGYDYKAYLGDWDRAHVPIRDGCEATTFEIAPLTRRQFLRVMQMQGLEQAQEAVAFGLKAMGRYVCDGQSVNLSWTSTEIGQRLCNECLDAIFEPDLMLDMGMAILLLSKLRPLR